MPEPDAETAWVDVRGRAGYTLSAMRLDGKKVTDARYFKVEQGSHSLELRLGRERRGQSAGSSWQHCRVNLVYEHFAAGQHYDIFAVLLGHGVRVWLRDGQGERIVESRSVRCGSQY